MNKKNIVTILFFIVVVVGFFIKDHDVVKDSISTNESKIKTKIVKKKMPLEDYLGQEKAKLDQLINKEGEEKVVVIKKSIAVLKKDVDCIIEETCTNIENKFYDKSLDPANRKVKNALKILDHISESEPEILEQINDESIVKVFETGHRPSMFLASTILLKKGKSSFIKSFESAKSFDGKTASSFIRIVDQAKGDDFEMRGQRNDLLKSYLSKDAYTVDEVLNAMNSIELNQDEAYSLVSSVCSKYKGQESLAAVKIKNKISLLARKFSQLDYCN